MDAILTLPTRMVGFTTYSAVIACCSMAAYMLVSTGYPRLPWTHHTLNAFSEANSAIERLFRAVEVIENSMKSGSSAMTERMQRAYGRDVAELVRLYVLTRGSSTRPSPEIIGKCIDLVLKTSLHAPSTNVTSFMTAVGRVGASDNNLSTLLSPKDTDDCKRIACALAEIRILSAHVLPEIAKVHEEKTRQYTQLQIITHHVSPEFERFVDRVTSAFDVREDGSEIRKADEIIAGMSALGDRLMSA